MRRAFLAGLVSLAWVTGVAAPVHAGEGGGEASSGVSLGGFAVGDGLEAMIDERDGSVSFQVGAGAVTVRWDSRAIGARAPGGFAGGWDLGLGGLEAAGGWRVRPVSGGWFEADASSASGLHGYDSPDTRFEVVAQREVSARDLVGGADSAGDARPVGASVAAAVLHELGGTTTFFDEHGRPIARSSATGQQIDWVWEPGRDGRLLRVIDAEDLVTELDWESEPGAVLIRAGEVHTPDGPATPEWRIGVDRGVIQEVTDPTGARTTFGYEDGLLTRIAAPSGATTTVAWQEYADGVSRVVEAATIDEDGRASSVRTWALAGGRAGGGVLPGGVLPSGWPARDSPAGGGSGEFTSTVSDGRTTVRSRYDSWHRNLSRTISVTTPSGEVELQEQRFEYPDLEPGQAARAGQAAKPTRTDVAYHDPAGRVRESSARLRYDELGRVVEAVAADGTVTTTRYDDRVPAGARVPIGLEVLQTVTAPDGLISEREHWLNDARTAVVASETRAGRVGAPLTVTGRAEYTVDADGFVTEERSFPAGASAGEPVVLQRNRQSDPAAGTMTVTETLAPGTEFEASTASTVSLVHGGVVHERDVLGRVTTAGYDVIGRPVLAVDPAGRQTRTSYETAQQHGRNATITAGPNGVMAVEERDSLGRVIRLTDNIDRGRARHRHVRVAETRDYPAPGVTRVTDAWGATTTTEQDVFGRTVRTTTPSGLVNVHEYDDVAGTATTGVSATGLLADAENVATQRTDESGQVVETSGWRADGVPVPGTTTTYDGFGRELSNSDGRRRTQATYDAFGNTVSTTVSHEPGQTGTAAGELILDGQRRFDPATGEVLEKVLTDGTSSRSGGARTTDLLGRTTTETDQAGRVTSYDYTRDGLVERAVESTGRVTNTTYDPVTRMPMRVSIEAPGREDVTVETEYDEVTGAPTNVFDPADRAGTEITTTYDDFGNPLTVTYPDGATITHEYDQHGRLHTTTDVEGHLSVQEYDDAGRLVAVRQHDGDEHTPVRAEVEYRYDEFDRVAELIRGNGTSTSYTYTAASEIASETTTHGTATLSEREYTYDADGQLTQRIDRVDHERTGALTSTTTAYAYDALGRLTESQVRDGEIDGPVTQRSDYELTVSGDVSVERTTIDGVTSTREFEYAPSGELLAVTTDGERREQQYDASGALTRDIDGTTYTYNASNHLTGKTSVDGRTTTIEYWADASRRTLTDEHGTATFYWAGGTLVNEHRDAGDTAYLLGAGRHARITDDPPADGARTDYYVTDRHGSTTELLDAEAQVSAAYAYTDYGTATTQSRNANPFQYAGELTDLDGSQPLGARIYLPKLMRFASPDPAPQHNTHGYADANPITRIDPTGLTATTDATPWVLLALEIAVTVAASVAQIATAGSIGALLGAVGALAFDIGATTTFAVNDHVEFMPASVAIMVGFAATAASLLVGKWVTSRAVKVKPDEVEMQNLVNRRRERRQVERIVWQQVPTMSAYRAADDPWPGGTVNTFITDENLNRHARIMNGLEENWRVVVGLIFAVRPDRLPGQGSKFDWTIWSLEVRHQVQRLRVATFRGYAQYAGWHFEGVTKSGGGLWGWLGSFLPGEIVETIRYHALRYFSTAQDSYVNLRDPRPLAFDLLRQYDRDFVGIGNLLPDDSARFRAEMSRNSTEASTDIGLAMLAIRRLQTHAYR